MMSPTRIPTRGSRRAQSTVRRDVKTYIGKQKAYRARKTKKGEFTADDVIGQRKPDRQTKPKTQRKAARRRSS